jgi:hypothetical protein
MDRVTVPAAVRALAMFGAFGAFAQDQRACPVSLPSTPGATSEAFPPTSLAVPSNEFSSTSAEASI